MSTSSRRPDRWYTTVFFLAGPGPQPVIAVSTFSRSPLGRTEMSSSFSSLSPPHVARCSSWSTFRLGSSFPLLLSCVLSSYCNSHTPLSTPSRLGSLLRLSVVTPLRHSTLFQPAFPLLPSTKLHTVAGSLVLGMFLTL